MIKTTAATYRKLPLGLPQRLDAVVVRHACLKGRGAHDPVLGTLRLAIPAGRDTPSAVRRHDAEMIEKES